MSERTVAFNSSGSPCQDSWSDADQPGPQPGQRDVGVDLIEADLDVPPTDAPATRHVIDIISAREEVADPSYERALETLDLGRSARDDFARIGMSLDFVVEILDERQEIRLQRRSGTHDPLRVGIGPSHVGLELAITVVEPIDVHPHPRRSLDSQKKAHASPAGDAWAVKTLPESPFVSVPDDAILSYRGFGVDEKGILHNDSSGSVRIGLMIPGNR